MASLGLTVLLLDLTFLSGLELQRNQDLYIHWDREIAADVIKSDI